MPTPVTPRAAVYALRELLRRAGASGDFIRCCQVQHSLDIVDLRFGSDSGKVIRFSAPNIDAPHSFSYRTWMNHGLPTPLEKFIVPGEGPEMPLFRQSGPGMLACSADLLGFTLFMLCRVEESVGRHDEHGRFSAASSVAYRSGFLERPIVDEYGLALQEAIQFLFPRWVPIRRFLRVKVSHDIDLVGIPFSSKASLGHLLRRRRPVAALLDIASVVTPTLPAYLAAVRSIAGRCIAQGLDSTIYWKVSKRTAWDSGYDLGDAKIRHIIDWADSRSIEMGLHPGYYTFGSLDALTDEVLLIRRLLGSRPLGGRQHFLRWSPETWLHWEHAGLAYDSTVGYADHIGFRAGTCVPYHPWIIGEDRESGLLEIPLLVMDGTLIEYMKLGSEEALRLVRGIIDRCAAVGGVFTLLWHNSSLLERRYEDIFGCLLDGLRGHSSYNWRGELLAPPMPVLLAGQV